jgi:ABC-type nitrate/sulfonate/bicarbonate transport system permease component
MKRVAIGAASALTAAGFFAIWESADDTQALYVSRPSAVAEALHKWLTSDLLRGYIVTTLKEAAAGLVLAVILAVVFASILASSRALAEFASPFIAAFNAVPKIALAPLFVLVFGVDFKSKVYFVVAVVFFVPFYSLFRALTTIDPTYLDNARTLGASRFALATDVYAPAVLGTTMTSLRVTATFALLSAVIAELISSHSGIGFQIAQAQATQQPDLILAGVAIVAAISYAIDISLRRIERRFAQWRVAA